MGPTTIGLSLLLALLALVPTRRLAIAGASRETIALYFVALWGLSLTVVLSGAPRILVLVVLVVYVVPFVTLGAGLSAVRSRLGGRPMKDVTPPDEVPPAA